ncbi:pentapeptide repeat-containing protein [uncultured Cohaesibacter sp.]|uniref:pentapeptide repeat-containing protein n=1 Tax=uncultured Cohaesibacter sp. TaxID=1002546 RepID=UPI002AA5EB96|nr:pentapeptide repeat-containing protein [uncultured Cohaesibacter sp.]
MSDEDFTGNPKDLEAIRKGVDYWNEYVKEQREIEGNWRANLRGADLRRTYLRRADLRAANLQGANLMRVDLSEAMLLNAKLQTSNMQGTNLMEANLQMANLRRTNLQKANLQKANLRRASLRDAYLVGAVLQEAKLRDAKLRDAKLQDADMTGSDLTRADLRGADLEGAIIRYATLYGTDLTNADLRGADLEENQLSELRLQEIKGEPEFLADSNVEDDVLLTKDGHTLVTEDGYSLAVETDSKNQEKHNDQIKSGFTSHPLHGARLIDKIQTLYSSTPIDVSSINHNLQPVMLETIAIPFWRKGNQMGQIFDKVSEQLRETPVYTPDFQIYLDNGNFLKVLFGDVAGNGDELSVYTEVLSQLLTEQHAVPYFGSLEDFTPEKLTEIRAFIQVITSADGKTIRKSIITMGCSLIIWHASPHIGDALGRNAGKLLDAATNQIVEMIEQTELDN